MTVDTGEIVKGVAEFVLADGTIIQNVYHFAALFADSQDDATVVTGVNGYVQDIYDDIDQYVDSNVTVNPLIIHVVRWDVTEGKWETHRLLGSTIPSITFTGATDPLPHQCSPVLVANTERPKTRGRKFLPPFLDTSADGPDWVGAVVTALGAALVNYLAVETLSANNLLFPGVPRTEENVFLAFLNGLVNSVVGTQRRRKPGVGI